MTRREKVEEKEIKIKQDKDGNKILVETKSTILDEDLIRRELNQIAVNKKNIETQVKYYQTAYKELIEKEKIYEKELKSILSTEESVGELFSLE